MTKIKLCGLRQEEDIKTANLLQPDYIGFVFAQSSRRFIDYAAAAQLKKKLAPEIQAVGVFVNEDISIIANLLQQGIIDAAQLHGQEDEAAIRLLQRQTGKKIIKAFSIKCADDVRQAALSPADVVSVEVDPDGAKSCRVSVPDHQLSQLLRKMTRKYFLAGGLTPANVAAAVRNLQPYGVDVSSGIETNGRKDAVKMDAFVRAVRNEV